MRTCFHCDLPIPATAHFSFIINGEPREFCCAGCEAVAGAIVHGGLSDYYKYRSTPATTPAPRENADDEALALYDRDDIWRQYATLTDEQTATLILQIDGITCAACTWLIEHQLQKTNGVKKIELNLSTHRATLVWDPHTVKLSTVLKEITRIGYHAEPFQAQRSEQQWQHEHRRALLRLGIAGIGMVQVMMYAAPLYIGKSADISSSQEMFFRLIGFILTTPVLLYSGHPFLIGALRDLRTRQLTMDVPITIGIWSAYLASVWSMITNADDIYFDSISMFIFLLLVSRYFEMCAHHRYAQSGNLLATLLPAHAWRLTGDQTQLCLVSELHINDCVLVKPGHIIPTDGVIINGESAVDEAMLTGESMPIAKKTGDTVNAGTINTEHTLTISVKRLGADSTLSGIIRLLERAQSEKPYLAKLADRLARWFIVTELLLSIAVGVVWAIIDPHRALWNAISILIVTCPCALSLAIPTALTAATTALRQAGILITHGHVLESVPRITKIVFDKTGTLTEGNIEIEKIIVCNNTIDEAQCKQIAASLEFYSEHPIAKAFKGLPTLPALDVKNHINQGISGLIQGVSYRIGTPFFALPETVITPPDDHCHWLLLSDTHQPLAWFAMNDRPRAEVIDVIDKLKQKGLQVALLSGDHSAAVNQLAQKSGIKEAYAGMTPKQKLQYIQSEQANKQTIMMVGDGINDVLGLARAHISVAMGNGTDLTRTQSDVILINNNLRGLLHLLDKSAATQRIIYENLVWTLLYNIVVIPLAACGLVTPYWATVGMSFSSMFVVANALRLSHYKSSISQSRH